ncbi:MAG: hypothetical protein P1V35_16475 [Planctomycetota bacterium]|nr:hypothetical protein [Planctomycetota bacterium]
MKTSALAVCLALTTFASSTAPDAPAFVPALDQTVVKSFGSSLEVELTRRVILDLSGADEVVLQDDAATGEIHRTSTEITWSDEYRSVEDGRILELRRTLTKGARSYSSERTGEEEFSGDRESRLIGHPIDFRWDADLEDYTADWVAIEGTAKPEDALLEGHEVMVEYVRLLPEKPVEEGDRWEVDPGVYFWLTMPGARTDIQIAESGEEFEAWVESMEQHKDSLSGEIHCTWESTEDGLATITIEGSVTAVTEQVEVDSEDPGSRYVFRNTTQYPVDGELVWDMQKNRAVSFFVEGAVEDRRDVIQEENGKPVYKWSSFYGGTLREESSFE